MKEFRILVDEEDESVTILRPDGSKCDLKGVVLFGADAELGASVALCFGCSADAAWGSAFQYRNPELKNYWVQLTAHIIKQIDPKLLRNEVTPDEILNRWEKEEKITYN